MLQLLWLVPALPLAGFLILLVGRSLPHKAVAAIGTLSVAGSMAVAIAVAAAFVSSPEPHAACVNVCWTWLNVGGFAPRIAFYLDALSLVMMLVVTVVGFLIHLYSTDFMAGEEGYGRFFAYMNLFVASMLILILGDNLLLLYLGWEGVGLCSYLLIGFWYTNPANGRAAMKAFIVTRVGDSAMAVGLFLLLWHLGTLDIQTLMARASAVWPAGSALPVAAAALLLGGAVGKSAQLPLQTWLPDAMAGPSPVSALIHAATMVTAGVYLIARTNVLFTLAPAVQLAVAVIGAVTLLVAGFSAMVQQDLKRVLAYSTISQIGYMFLALGVGAWSAALFHFVTHALFKALLFLAAGVVILAMDDEHNMFRMGGLWRKMPLTFWTFLAGACSLAALPLVTAGFYSKDLILFHAWGAPRGGPILWGAGIVGAFITSVYTFRMVFVTFFGKTQIEPVRRPGLAMGIPLVALAAGSILAGFLNVPRGLWNHPVLTDFLETALPAMAAGVRGEGMETTLQLEAAAVALVGIALAYVLFLGSPHVARKMAEEPQGAALRRFWLAGWGFDWLYDRLFVQPFVWFARVNSNDFFDSFFRAIGYLNQMAHSVLVRTQTGHVRWYAAAVAAGAVAITALVVLS